MAASLVPVALKLAPAALQVFGAVANHGAEDEAYEQQLEYNRRVEENAERAYLQDLTALQLQQRQDEKASKQKAAERTKEVAREKSSAANSMAGAGVAGLSLDSILADFERQEADYKDSVLDNLGSRNTQRMQEADAAHLRYSSRLNNIQTPSRPSIFNTALKIGGHGLEGYDAYKED